MTDTDVLYPEFSVCMSVYKNDNANDFLAALRSISIKQTVKPQKIILVVDGPISEAIDKVISSFATEFENLQVIRLKENKGNAIARQTAINEVQTPWFAIMDSDDIAQSDRFEKQLSFIISNPSCDAVGGQIKEFIGTTDNIVGKRAVPLADEDVKKYMKSRCPMNFMTVMLRREQVENVGGVVDWYYEEDYYLWIRMALAGCTFANLPDTLVNVRVGKDMYQRRGGWRYFKSERKIQRFMLKNKLIGLPRYCYNVLGRFVVQVLMTNRMRSFVFQKLFRQ